MAFSLLRLDQARASSFSISSLNSLPGGSAAGSPCEEPVPLLALSSSGPSRNVAISAGVPAATSVGLTQGSWSGCDRQPESDQNSVDNCKTMLKTKERSGRYWA